MARKETATEAFNKGLACSQAVAIAFAQDYGIETDAVLKLSRGFGGGMGGMGGVCGAVTGAYMVIGMHYDPADLAVKARIYEKVQQFTRLFIERHGESSCRGLLGCDVSSDQGKAMMKEKNLREIRCACFVRNAVEILEEILV